MQSVEGSMVRLAVMREVEMNAETVSDSLSRWQGGEREEVFANSQKLKKKFVEQDR